MNKPNPNNVHLKALLACLALIVFGIGYSWAVPVVHVALTRNGERVEGRIQKKMLGLISYETTKFTDLKQASLKVEQGTWKSGGNKTSDSAYLVLVDAEGDEQIILLESGNEMIMTRAEKFTESIEHFLRSDERALSNWTVSFIGYGAFVPAVLGFLFLALVAFDFAGKRLKSFRSKSSRTVEQSTTGPK